MKYKHTNRDNNEKFIDIIRLIAFDGIARRGRNMR